MANPAVMASTADRKAKTTVAKAVAAGARGAQGAKAGSARDGRLTTPEPTTPDVAHKFQPGLGGCTLFFCAGGALAER